MNILAHPYFMIPVPKYASYIYSDGAIGFHRNTEGDEAGDGRVHNPMLHGGERPEQWTLFSKRQIRERDHGKGTMGRGQGPWEGVRVTYLSI
jgi:hypothetical protein